MVITEVIAQLEELYEEHRKRRQEAEKDMYVNQAFDKMEPIERMYVKEHALRLALVALKEGFNV